MKILSVFSSQASKFRVLLALLLPALVAVNTSACAVEPEKLEIVTSHGPEVLSVEVMRNPADRAQGLMFRRFMPQDRGMLFDFEAEQPVMMWMKNTILPLDMVFIRHDGRIANVAESTEPMSEATIPSAGPVSGVLELNAGAAARLGIKKGDVVRHKMFAN